jgi:hypothetical protein
MALVPVLSSIIDTDPGASTAIIAILLHFTGKFILRVCPASSSADLFGSTIGFSPTTKYTLTDAMMLTGPLRNTGVDWLNELACIEYDAIWYL